MINEFWPAGPRVVHQDEHGFYVKFEGSRVYDPRLEAWLGNRVHVTALLDGFGFEIRYLLERTVSNHPIGGRTRSGHMISNADDPQQTVR